MDWWWTKQRVLATCIEESQKASFNDLHQCRIDYTTKIDRINQLKDGRVGEAQSYYDEE